MSQLDDAIEQLADAEGELEVATDENTNLRATNQKLTDALRAAYAWIDFDLCGGPKEERRLFCVYRETRSALPPETGIESEGAK
jgi:hypothetical protein